MGWSEVVEQSLQQVVRRKGGEPLGESEVAQERKRMAKA